MAHKCGRSTLPPTGCHPLCADCVDLSFKSCTSCVANYALIGGIQPGGCMSTCHCCIRPPAPAPIPTSPQTVVHAATHTQTCSSHAWGCVQSMLSIACFWPAVAVSEMRLALRCADPRCIGGFLPWSCRHRETADGYHPLRLDPVLCGQRQWRLHANRSPWRGHESSHRALGSSGRTQADVCGGRKREVWAHEYGVVWARKL